jgi:hypothetical protein
MTSLGAEAGFLLNGSYHKYCGRYGSTTAGTQPLRTVRAWLYVYPRIALGFIFNLTIKLVALTVVLVKSRGTV